MNLLIRVCPLDQFLLVCSNTYKNSSIAHIYILYVFIEVPKFYGINIIENNKLQIFH